MKNLLITLMFALLIIGSVEAVAPTIPIVYPVSAITLNGGTVSEIVVDFNVTDGDGWGDILISTIDLTLTRGGEEIRHQKNSSCGMLEFDTNHIKVRCSVEMQFYDGEGAWNISVSINDTTGSKATNDSTGTTVNALDYVTQDFTYVDWGSLTTNTNDNEADNTITLTNGGNQDYPTSNLKAYDLIGDVSNETINANLLSIDNVGSATSGQIYLQNATNIEISTKINLNGHNSTATSQMFFYVDVPSLSLDTYRQLNLWEISVS